MHVKNKEIKLFSRTAKQRTARQQIRRDKDNNSRTIESEETDNHQEDDDYYPNIDKTCFTKLDTKHRGLWGV